MENRNNKVIVTIATGDKHYLLWKKYASPSWEKYAKKYGYDIICFQQPLDESTRARSRSVAWQKCLILKDERVRTYERVVWLDADIVINYFNAPCIVSKVNKGRIGGINAWESPGISDYNFLHERMRLYCKKHSLPHYNIGRQYLIDFGLPGISDKAAQSGVLVLTPGLHDEVLRKIYEEYEDKGPASWHYEMRPLSYEVISQDVVQWIDSRFNLVVENVKLAGYFHKYPRNYFERLMRIMRIKGFRILSFFGVRLWQESAVNEALVNGYFIHFAGNAKEMIFLENFMLD